MLRPFPLIKEVLFRIAFCVCILVQIGLWGLLAAGMSDLLVPHGSVVVDRILFCLIFGGLFPIGAANYFLYHRIVREEYIPLQAEKWLAERRTARDRGRKRRSLIKRLGLWIPTVVVILVCTFLDYTWAFASHLFHPGRGRLIGYEVSIPLNWTIQYSDLGRTANSAHDMVAASRFRGLWKAGSGLSARRRPFSASMMNFRSNAAGDPSATRPATTIISERTLPFGQRTISCREELPPRWMTSARYINCSTPTGDFSGHFDGSDGDALEFYRTVESVKPTK